MNASFKNSRTTERKKRKKRKKKEKKRQNPKTLEFAVEGLVEQGQLPRQLLRQHVRQNGDFFRRVKALAPHGGRVQFFFLASGIVFGRIEQFDLDHGGDFFVPDQTGGGEKVVHEAQHLHVVCKVILLQLHPLAQHIQRPKPNPRHSLFFRKKRRIVSALFHQTILEIT
jgi:hypothetical protein